MRIGQVLRAANWKYAIGEILLIVIGITIALAVNSWYADWQDRMDEEEFLEALLTSLEEDLAEFQETFEFHQDTDRLLRELQGHMRSGLPYRKALDANFGRLGVWSAAQLNTAIFETLRARGLDLISDPTLRIALVDLYDQERTDIETRNDITREEILRFTHEVQLRSFENLGFPTATPRDYESLLKEDLFFSHFGLSVEPVESSRAKRLRAGYWENPACD